MSRPKLKDFLTLVPEEKHKEFTSMYMRFVGAMPKPVRIKAVPKSEVDSFIRLCFEWSHLEMGISAVDIINHCRKREIADVRQVIMWAIRTEFENGISYESIGSMFNRDHATILHAMRNIKNASYNPSMMKLLDSFASFMSNRGVKKFNEEVMKLKLS